MKTPALDVLTAKTAAVAPGQAAIHQAMNATPAPAPQAPAPVQLMSIPSPGFAPLLARQTGRDVAALSRGYQSWMAPSAMEQASRAGFQQTFGPRPS